MIIVFLFLTAGLLVGFILKNKTKFIALADKFTILSIYLLLFFLGLSIGSNKEIVSNFLKIGLQGIIISLGAISGSVLLSMILYKTVFKKEDDD